MASLANIEVNILKRIKTYHLQWTGVSYVRIVI